MKLSASPHPELGVSQGEWLKGPVCVLMMLSLTRFLLPYLSTSLSAALPCAHVHFSGLDEFF
jgi:hypothetical protein